MARCLVLRHDLRPGRRRSSPAFKRRGPRPAISDQALGWMANRSRPGGIALSRRARATARSGLGFGSGRAHPGCPQAGLSASMRENNLLSPHRCRRRGGNPHDGEIITHAPNLMWGTDGVRVFTVDDGWGWIFRNRRRALERRVCRLACIVCKRGDRFAALQPILHGACRAVWLDRGRRGRGLALRMDHGSQYLSDHFTNQIKFWQASRRPTDSSPSPRPTVVAPSGSIVTLRSRNRSSMRSGIYRNIAELRDAVRDFVELYNRPVDRRKERLPEPRSSSPGNCRTPRSQSGSVRIVRK